MTLGGVSDTQDAWGNMEKNRLQQYRSEDLLKILAEFTVTSNRYHPCIQPCIIRGRDFTNLPSRVGSGAQCPRNRDQIPADAEQGEDDEDNPVIELEIQCSKGTYIRTLCHDMRPTTGNRCLHVKVDPHPGGNI
jgi:tRNA pseudouridine55 synthase